MPKYPIVGNFMHWLKLLYFFTDFQNQINDITSYIDASNVYGSSDEEPDELRSFTGGKYMILHECSFY